MNWLIVMSLFFLSLFFSSFIVTVKIIDWSCPISMSWKCLIQRKEYSCLVYLLTYHKYIYRPVSRWKQNRRVSDTTKKCSWLLPSLCSWCFFPALCSHKCPFHYVQMATEWVDPLMQMLSWKCFLIFSVRARKLHGLPFFNSFKRMIHEYIFAFTHSHFHIIRMHLFPTKACISLLIVAIAILMKSFDMPLLCSVTKTCGTMKQRKIWQCLKWSTRLHHLPTQPVSWLRMIFLLEW